MRTPGRRSYLQAMAVRPGVRPVIWVLTAGLTLLGCSTAPDNAETDRIVDVVSLAIVYPRQDSAVGLARAAAHTTAAEDGRLTVYSAEDLEAESLQDPHARLGLRIDLPGQEAGFVPAEPVTACYTVEFNYYRATSTSRIGCPATTSAMPDPAGASHAPH